MLLHLQVQSHGDESWPLSTVSATVQPRELVVGVAAFLLAFAWYRDTEIRPMLPYVDSSINELFGSCHALPAGST